MSGQLHVPATLLPLKELTHLIGGWVGGPQSRYWLFNEGDKSLAPAECSDLQPEVYSTDYAMPPSTSQSPVYAKSYVKNIYT
jgi:hypothetical protein